MSLAKTSARDSKWQLHSSNTRKHGEYPSNSSTRTRYDVGSLGFFRHPNSKNGTLARSHVQRVYQGAARVLFGGNDYEDETQFQVCQCTWQRLLRCYKHMCPFGVRISSITMEHPHRINFSQTPTMKRPAKNDIIST